MCDTICSILTKFFQRHQDSMHVVCDSSDGREMSRMRLFESWYRILAPEDLKKLTAVARQRSIACFFYDMSGMTTQIRND